MRVLGGTGNCGGLGLGVRDLAYVAGPRRILRNLRVV